MRKNDVTLLPSRYFHSCRWHDVSATWYKTNSNCIDASGIEVHQTALTHKTSLVVFVAKAAIFKLFNTASTLISCSVCALRLKYWNERFYLPGWVNEPDQKVAFLHIALVLLK